VKLASFEALVRALNDAAVRYPVAGGLAVNAYGYLRFTKDVDFVVQPAPDNVVRAFTAIQLPGYRPMVPSRRNSSPTRPTALRRDIS
jgi:hypothetical protein